MAGWEPKQDPNSVDRRMSTRQNKKRKGRGNVINRERTVTTLTEGSEGSFMASEDSHTNLMSSPFSVASSATNASTISPGFPVTPSFPTFSYGYMPSLSPGSQDTMFNQQQNPTTFYAAPGQNDLEILERLKDTIKAGQHEFFQPIPRPAALASVYLGPHQVSQVPPHPEQIPQDHKSMPGRGDFDGRRRSPVRTDINGEVTGARRHDGQSSVSTFFLPRGRSTSAY